MVLVHFHVFVNTRGGMCCARRLASEFLNTILMCFMCILVLILYIELKDKTQLLYTILAIVYVRKEVSPIAKSLIFVFIKKV